MKTTITTSICCMAMITANAANYRSRAGGDWATPTTWEMHNGSGWVSPVSPPGIADIVTVRSPHTVQIATADAHAAAVTIDYGASLLLSGATFELFVYDGLPGADLLVNGTFQDNGSSANGLNMAGGTWQLGATGTLVKTNNSSAAVYRDFYHNGMQNIPPTGRWIIRRIAGDVSFTTVGTYYPNLIIESYNGNWNPAVGASRFQGAAGTAFILGDFDVGGSGSGSVTVYNENTFFQPLTILGQCLIRPGSVLTNNGSAAGTGFEFMGNLQIGGLLQVTAGSGVVRFSGGGPTVTGGGSAQINYAEVNCGYGLILQRPLTINYDLSLFNGKVILQQYDLTVMGEVVGSSTGKYIQTTGIGSNAGSLVMPVSGSRLFPVGNNSYNPAILQQGGYSLLKVRVEDWVLSQGISGAPVIAGIVSRTWHLGGSLSGNLNLTLQWASIDEWPGFDRSACYISQFTGANWQQAGPGPASGGDPFIRTRTGISGATSFAVSSGSALPVELARFDASALQGAVELSWQTWSETGNKRFVIEHSPDGIHYADIGEAPGAGTTAAPQAYVFLDKNPSPGPNYYRLRQEDFDGDSHYSEVRYAWMDVPANALRGFPTIVNQTFTLQLDFPVDAGFELFILDSYGRVAMTYHWPARQKEVILNTEILAPGWYHIFQTIIATPGQVRFLRP